MLEMSSKRIACVSFGNLKYMESPAKGNELVVSEPQPHIRRRKKKSIVWEYFTIETVGSECRRASCNQCKQTFAYSNGSKVAGTSHLKRHIAKGTCPVRNHPVKSQLTSLSAPSKIDDVSAARPKRRYRTKKSISALAPFDPDSVRRDIAKMIIAHDYPLHIVEHPAFVSFVKSLEPRFDMVSFNNVQGDCVATYLTEKGSIQKLIEGISGRVSLSVDIWTSSRTVGYMFLTGHFIDNDWNLHTRILNVITEPFPESEFAFSRAVSACVSDWGLENKLFSVTLNRASNEIDVGGIRAQLSLKNPLVLNGQFLLGSCISRSLSSMAQDILQTGRWTVDKIRNSVKYVKDLDSQEEKSLEAKQIHIPSVMSLTLDDRTKWNTTYQMLANASELKDIFSCLDTSDPDYKESPTAEDWKIVDTLCVYLKLLFDTLTILTKANPTPNVFFHEVWRIQTELSHANESDDVLITAFTKPTMGNLEKYLKDCSMVLAIAVVMDPRFKMKLVEFSFTKIYGEDSAANIRIVDSGIHELFLEYTMLPQTFSYIGRDVNGNIMSEGNQKSGFLSGNGLSDFDVYIMETSGQHMKTELDQYLEESLLPRIPDFDVLGWWKTNSLKYPTLSRMARDVLSVTVSTAPPECVFDNFSREMNEYMCSLRPVTAEALICAKDWLRYGLSDDSIARLKMEYF